MGARGRLDSVYKPCAPGLLYLDDAAWEAAIAPLRVVQLSPLAQAPGPGVLDSGGRIGRNFAPERQQESISLFGAVAEHLQAGKFAELNDAFWNVIPFGTGGRRGKMYPIGSAVMNARTGGESAQVLADYFRNRMPADSLACSIACDTRHRSPKFARFCAAIMAASW